MITLLASIAGFIGSLIPEILKMIKDRFDKKHELDIIDLEIKKQQYVKTSNDKNTLHKYDIQCQKQLYATYSSGINWVDALNSSVRPVLAYSFFFMYSAVKYAQYFSIKQQPILIEYLNILWTVDDQAIFAGIISFYFGQRTFNKLWKIK